MTNSQMITNGYEVVDCAEVIAGKCNIKKPATDYGAGQFNQKLERKHKGLKR